MPVERRDLLVSVSASGDIEPNLTVDVKSKASGEIIEMRVETGDEVRAGDLLARIDPRLPRNTLAQAEANLDVARAQLQNARAQLDRAEKLFNEKLISEVEIESSKLAHATANAAVVRAESDLETARDAMEDTQVKAPLSGTIIQKSVELGTVISSPTRDVGGGTVLFRMANLDTMQVRTLVDETDIGKVQPGPPAEVRVDAYPNRPFSGRVLKVEPLAVVQQNVTMFPVLIDIANPGHLLKPGMNAEVEVRVGERRGVLTVPNAALRTPRDVASAAQVLGLDPETVQRQVAQQTSGPAAAPGAADSGSSISGTAAATEGDAAVARGGAMLTLPDGRQVPLPAGVDPEQVRAAMRKRMSGGEPSAAERALLRQVFSQMHGPGGGRGAGGGRGPGGSGPGAGVLREDFSGSYIVFALRSGKPVPVQIRTGLTDLDHTEVLGGLVEGDTVLVLPSASLLAAQREFRERFQRITGGGVVPGMQQQQQQRGGGQTPGR